MFRGEAVRNNVWSGRFGAALPPLVRRLLPSPNGVISEIAPPRECVAIYRKRHTDRGRVLQGHNVPGIQRSPLDATRAQRVRSKPLHTKGFQPLCRFHR